MKICKKRKYKEVLFLKCIVYQNFKLFFYNVSILYNRMNRDKLHTLLLKFLWFINFLV